MSAQHSNITDTDSVTLSQDLSIPGPDGQCNETPYGARQGLYWMLYLIRPPCPPHNTATQMSPL